MNKVPADQINPAGLVLKCGDTLIPWHRVESVDLAAIETDGTVTIHTTAKAYMAYGFDAVEVVMQVKPSALEGKRLKYGRHKWALHNLVAHPLMQLLAFAGFSAAAIRLHDWSTPAPRAPAPPST